MKKWTVLVVDVNPPTRRVIHAMLGQYDHVDVVGECDHAQAAVDAIHQLRPDILFIDVQMPGATGLDEVHSAGLDTVPIVVFTTSFEDVSALAFDAHAFDYLLKPFSDERFGAVMMRVLTALDRAHPAIFSHRPRTLIVKPGDDQVVIPVSEINWIEAEDYCTKIHAGRRRPLIRRSMQSVIDELQGDGFMRTHRSSIVNLAKIREIRPLPNGDASLLLFDGAILPLTRSHRVLVEHRFRHRHHK